MRGVAYVHLPLHLKCAAFALMAPGPRTQSLVAKVGSPTSDLVTSSCGPQPNSDGLHLVPPSSVLVTRCSCCMMILTCRPCAGPSSVATTATPATAACAACAARPETCAGCGWVSGGRMAVMWGAMCWGKWKMSCWNGGRPMLEIRVWTCLDSLDHDMFKRENKLRAKG